MKKEIFGHPRGLLVLFSTEMWERFSFYGMRALLILYLAKYLLIDPTRSAGVWGYSALSSFLTSVHGPLEPKAMASHIYGIYFSLAYALPILGGILADQWLGQRKTVYLGGILMAFGHFFMAIESLVLVALALIALGNGCFKPNISTQVGRLYSDTDPRKDGAFTLFYMGINLGALLGSQISGTLGQKAGWHYGFTAAGFGMLLGLAIFHAYRRDLPADSPKKKDGRSSNSIPLDRHAIKKMLGLLLLFPLSIAFWMLNEQQGNALQLFADEKTDWHILGFDIASTTFQSLNPAMVILFAPLLDRWWRSRGRQGASSILKMGWGCVLAGLGFGVILLALQFTGEGQKMNVLWLVAATFIMTLGELYLSPIGLSLVSKLAHPRFVSMMMGFWFLNISLGAYAAGWFGSFYGSMHETRFFTLLMLVGLGAGSLFFLAHLRARDTLGNV